MIDWAILYDVILAVGVFLITFLGNSLGWTTGITVLNVAFLLGNAIFWGYKSIPLYVEKMEMSFSKRGLFNRVDEQNEVIENSLRKEGKPSVIRAVVYRILVNMFFTTIVCLLQLYLWKTGGTAV